MAGSWDCQVADQESAVAASGEGKVGVVLAEVVAVDLGVEVLGFRVGFVKGSSGRLEVESKMWTTLTLTL